MLVHDSPTGWSSMELCGFSFQKTNSLSCILDFFQIWLDLLLLKLAFEKRLTTINFSFVVSKGKVVPMNLTTIWQLLRSSVGLIFCKVVPTLSRLKLYTTSIRPHNVAYWKNCSFVVINFQSNLKACCTKNKLYSFLSLIQ